jgi:hypothetical protein
MNEDLVREAIIDELRRQAQADPAKLEVSALEEDLVVKGQIDLDALAMAIIGSMAGGP